MCRLLCLVVGWQRQVSESGQTMVTKAMTLWMNRAVPGQPVYPEGHGAPVGGDWIGLWLLGLEPSPSTADLATRPYRLTMTYRLQPMTADPLTAHERLCDLMFAAMTNPWLEQDPDAKIGRASWRDRV